MSDGGLFGSWISDVDGLPAFEIIPSLIGAPRQRNESRSSGDWRSSEVEGGLDGAPGWNEVLSELSNLVLPEGGMSRLWHLVGATTLVATAHLCGDITLYYPPRTLIKLTGDPGSQARTFFGPSGVFSLDNPARVVFGCGYCEWEYWAPALVRKGERSSANPHSPQAPEAEEAGIWIRRRVSVESEGRLLLEVQVEQAPENFYYEEVWTLAPEALMPVPLMGRGPIGRGRIPVADAGLGHKLARFLAYGVSGALRGAGSIARSASRLAYLLEVQESEGRAVVVRPDSVSGLSRSTARIIVGAPGTRPEEPAVIDATMPAVVFEIRGEGTRRAGGGSPPGFDKESGTSNESLRGGGSGTLSGSGGRGRAEVTIRFEPSRANNLSLRLSVLEDGIAAPPGGTPGTNRRVAQSHKRESDFRSERIPPVGDSAQSTDTRSTPPGGFTEGIPPVGDSALERELVWHLSYLRQLAVADAYFGRRFVTQGSAYTFLQGAHGAPRDYAISAAALAGADPDLARSTLEVMLMMTKPSGSMFYMHTGRGWCSDAVVHSRPSDLPIFLVWAICEYIEASGDEAFLDVSVPFYPLHAGEEATVADRLVLAFRWLEDKLGRGPHGMLRVGSGDWADPISMMVGDAKAFHRYGESGLNTAFAAYALRAASRLLRSRDPLIANEMDDFAAELADAMKSSWTGRWYLRGWDGKGNPLGDSHLFLDAQAFCLIAGIGSDADAETLIREIRTRCIDPSPIGAVILDRPHPIRLGLIPAGWDCNGGVWAAINAFLAWGLARYDRELAIECLRKQTLASHARSYPGIWYGIWSGPDSYNAHYAECPGETFNLPATPMSEYPVMNSNAHAGPLLAARKIFGGAADGTG